MRDGGEPDEGDQPGGKVARAVFDRLIFPRLGRRRADVLVGPRHGVDVGVVDLGDGRVMALTTDPLFIMPAYGWERAAWFAVHILLSMPSPPVWRRTSPPSTSICRARCRRARSIRSGAWSTASAIVWAWRSSPAPGHYDGCRFRGGGTIVCIGPRIVTPAMALVGDAVIVTKGVAIEAVGQLGAAFPAAVEQRCGATRRREAEALFAQMSVVVDAMTAADVGLREAGVTSMHDATEFGLQGALVEVAGASGVGLRIERGAIPVPGVVADVCAAFAMDPYAASSEGTLLTCRPSRAAEVVARLSSVGVPAAIVGEVVPAADGVKWKVTGEWVSLLYPSRDPFWDVFTRVAAQAGARCATWGDADADAAACGESGPRRRPSTGLAA